MYTECPGCHTYFKVTPAQLKIAEGKVRCGSCNEVFNALSSLVEVVPPLSSQDKQDDEVAEQAEDLLSTPLDVMDQQSDLVNEQVDDDIPATEFIEEPAADAQDDASLALVEDEPQTMAVQTQMVEDENLDNALSDINKDIDEALDDLFTDDDLKSEVVSSEISALDKSNSSVIGMYDEPEPVDAQTPPKEENFSEIDFDETSSKPEPISKSTPISKPSPEKNSQLTEPSDFDLGDSVIESKSEEMDAEEWNRNEQQEKERAPRASDHYVLEELQESAASGSSGGLAKFGWITLILILLVFLVTQFAYLKREELSKYASVRPALEAMCSVLGQVVQCEIPDPRDLSAIDFLDRNVVTHPNAKNALLITSVIKSDAGFPQVFPRLELTFSDINQKIIARRTFLPEEYLPKEVNIAAGMQPGIPVKIMLEIVDPGEEAVNFEFDFK